MIRVQLFDTPFVMKGQGKVRFPFRKAEALFYYLHVTRQASRDELVDLLWGELEEETAKKNLRNALYIVNKVVHPEILASPQKTLVLFNPDIPVASDLDMFNQNRHQALQVYTGPFLKGFFVKNGEGFETWMRQKGDLYRNRFIKLLYEEIEAKQEEGGPVDELALQIIDMDEFDERAYRILMSFYRDMGTCYKAIELYQRLCRTLNDELGIQPEGLTSELYLEISSERNLTNKMAREEREAFFFGRQSEMARIQNSFRLNQQREKTTAVMILGEAGIGKTRLKDFFLKNLPGEVCLLESYCYQAEREYPLKPWHHIFSRMVQRINRVGIDLPEVWVSGLTPLFPAFAMLESKKPGGTNPPQEGYTVHTAMEAILEIIAALTRKGRLVLVFEDLQWMDEMSRQLLKSILLAPGIHIFFVGTCRSGYEAEIDGWLTPLVKEDRLEKVVLEGFTMEEARDFARQLLPEIRLKEDQFQKIYRETEGNTFFLVEYLNNVCSHDRFDKMSPKIRDILQSRFLDVSEEGMKLVYLLSLFFHRVGADLLADLTGKDKIHVMDILAELTNKGLIREVAEPGKVSVEFTHQKLREYIYTTLPSLKKRLLHEKAARVLESKLKGNPADMLQYSTLIHHYTRAGNNAAALSYHLKNLGVYLDYSHELFPEIIDIPGKPRPALALSKEQLQKHFNKVENILQHLAAEEDEAILLDRMTYLYMKGRHLIRQGEYENGVQLIRNLIDLAVEHKQGDFQLKGYIQMALHCIQVHQAADMKVYLQMAREVRVENPRFETRGVLLRLLGLCHMMSGESAEAERFFGESISYFREGRKGRGKYDMNIAGCYNYLGEIRRYAGKFAEALGFYRQALKICQDAKVYRSHSYFNTCAGQAALDMGDDEAAFTHLNQALQHYEESDLVWRRSIAEAYLSLLLIRRGQTEGAMEHLESAGIYAAMMQNPYELGLVWWVKTQVRAMMEDDRQLEKVFKGRLDRPVSHYAKKSLDLLAHVPYCYEAEKVRKFMGNILMSKK